MISSSIRNLVALFFWLAITAAVFYANFQIVIANYLGTKSALEVQGYEPQPLSTDPLVGHLFGSFFPGATLAQFFALGVAIVISLSFFGLFHIGGEIYELNEIRIDSQDLAEQARARRRICLWLVAAGIVLIALIPAVGWDLELFRYRTIAGALTAGEPDVTPLKYPGFAEFLVTYDSQYINALIRIGPWGYLGITILSCGLLEIAFRQLSDRWARLMQPIDEAFEPNEEFYGYDEQGRSVYDIHAAITYDTDGNPVAADDHTILDQPVRMPRQADQPVPAPTHVSSNGAPAVAGQLANSDQSGPLFEMPVAPTPATSDVWPEEVDPLPQSDPTDLRNVIGDLGNRVTLATAQADPAKYRVDPATGSIWDRNHWEKLHRPPSDPETEQ